MRGSTGFGRPRILVPTPQLDGEVTRRDAFNSLRHAHFSGLSTDQLVRMAAIMKEPKCL